MNISLNNSISCRQHTYLKMNIKIQMAYLYTVYHPNVQHTFTIRIQYTIHITTFTHISNHKYYQTSCRKSSLLFTMKHFKSKIDSLSSTSPSRASLSNHEPNILLFLMSHCSPKLLSNLLSYSNCSFSRSIVVCQQLHMRYIHKHHHKYTHALNHSIH